jgi:sensor domain CHASE-containing protein
MQQSSPTPLARSEDLVVHEVEDEALIYDLRCDKAYCLNPTTAAVWEQCNGHHTIEDITQSLSASFQTPVDADIVRLALQQLRKSGLLQSDATPRASISISRRTLLRRLGSASVIALPLITYIVAPTAANAASCIADSQCNTANLGNCCCTVRRKCQQVAVLFLCLGSPC